MCTSVLKIKNSIIMFAGPLDEEGNTPFRQTRQVLLVHALVRQNTVKGRCTVRKGCTVGTAYDQAKIQIVFARKTLTAVCIRWAWLVASCDAVQQERFARLGGLLSGCLNEIAADYQPGKAAPWSRCGEGLTQNVSYGCRQRDVQTASKVSLD